MSLIIKTMEGDSPHRYRLFLLIIFLSFVSGSSSFPAISSGPLYDGNDFVYSLNASTIQQKIFYSGRAWLVEFYSSWCGHCVAFAPKWKQFADDLREWRSLVVIAAIDCANEFNTAQCRQFEIMGYPTLKLFGKNAPSKVLDDGQEVLNIGEVFKRPESMNKLKTNLIEALEPMFPKILGDGDSFSNRLTSPEEFWKDPEFSQGAPFLLLVFESTNSFVGREVALRLSRYNDSVRVLRFHKKNPIYDSLDLTGWPAAAYLSKEGYSGNLILGTNQDIVDLLTKASIQLARITQIEEKPVGAEADHTSHVENANDNLLHTEDKVSMEDLLQTIRNLLRNEVGLLKTLDGSKLTALKNLVGILSQHFPYDRREVKLFLVKLHDWLLPEQRIETVAYLEKITELESELYPWDVDLNIWYDCRATVPGRRGYTCGLWRLFHTLTVVALQKNEDAPVLPAIAGYVREFFGCMECRKHFGEMVERDGADQLHSIREQAIWLWKAHNKVNLRLKGTPSEDPSFPKGNYPPSHTCGECYKHGEFDETEVEEYLLSVYTRPERYINRADHTPMRKSSNSTAKKLKSSTGIGGFFSLADVGILMILYFSIALLLIFAFIHFKVARRKRYDPIFCLHRFWSRIMKTLFGV